MAVETSAPVFQNYIAGKWVAAAGGKTFQRENPADWREIVGVAQDSGVEEVARAVEAAAVALPAWRALSAVARGEYLRRAADALERRAEDVARTMTREMGKTIGEARAETLRGVTILRYYAGEGMREIGAVVPSVDPRQLLFTTRVPLGVVAVVTPWNFPVAIPCWKIAPALVYGNTVVFKPASYTPVTAAKVVEAFIEAGLPEGVLNFVTGRGGVVGQALAEHPLVNGITFTGSNEVGKQVAAAALARGAKYQLEMGGKNPVIVCEDADMAQAVELTVSGAMRTTGQRCTATSRAIVLRPVLKEFTERVVARVRELKVGPGLDESVYLGPQVSRSQRETVLGYIEKGKQEGARLLVGGGVPTGELYDHGYYVEPTVFDHVTPEMTIAQEEIFGPVLAIMAADSLEQAIAIANGVKYGLSASIFTHDINKILTFIQSIEAGMVRINGETAGVEPQAPFGGMKASSSHSREQGRAALEFFTSVKTVTVARAG
jgi:aldehyde dehydrogenase (NAD+)